MINSVTRWQQIIAYAIKIVIEMGICVKKSSIKSAVFALNDMHQKNADVDVFDKYRMNSFVPEENDSF